MYTVDMSQSASSKPWLHPLPSGRGFEGSSHAPRSYDSEEEQESRFQIFAENLRQIEKCLASLTDRNVRNGQLWIDFDVDINVYLYV
jgi:hypothetical protein